MKVKVESKYLAKNFKKIADIEDAIIKELTTSGDILVEYAKLLAPVDTGQLRDATKKRFLRAKGSKYKLEVYNDCEYCAYQELGTGIRGAGQNSHGVPKSKKRVAYSSSWLGNEPQPFLYPALYYNKDDIVKRLMKIVKGHIKEGKKKK